MLPTASSKKGYVMEEARAIQDRPLLKLAACRTSLRGALNHVIRLQASAYEAAEFAEIMTQRAAEARAKKR
ncbi:MULTISPECIES: hypothetical protein [unclassified Bradyrhizobium]